MVLRYTLCMSKVAGQKNGAMEVQSRAKVFAALSDPTRVRLADLLACRAEMSGTEIAGELRISLALFCHHSSKMAEAGLLARRKEGQTTYYALNRDALSQSVEPLLCTSLFPTA
ncbi:MAG: hypothetical protein JWN98_4 [Abditibacteriota bacterium]|jgi:ArsR family transcriptional regulator|nr:hypothetical protein [Abditibacteriota bacterium]